MNLTERREQFRAILAGDRCVLPASVWDPISARIAEDLGIPVGMLAGSTASGTVLGAPDVVVLTLTEIAQQVHRISRASNLSMMVDGDHGYGNALNVQRTVEEMESAGAACLTIEDTWLPMRFGTADEGAVGTSRGAPRPKLVPLEEAVGKMKAALSGRQDPSLVIAGRTDLREGGAPEAVRRGQAYEKVGVDALFLSGVETPQEIEEIHAGVKLPILLGGANQVADHEFLGARGVRTSLHGHLPFWASVKAVYDTMKALRDGVPSADLKETQPSRELVRMVTRQGDYDQWTKDFLG